MSAEPARKPRIVVEVDPELRRRIKMAAAAHDETIREYMVTVVLRRLEEDVASSSWSALSSVAFARDWDSQEDAVYDQL
jgi:uncharacterized protein (DUF1778 family)